MLRAEGFNDWTSRSAWRRNGGRIEHVEFRSFSTHYAESFGCTPASVSVWLGIQLPEFSVQFNPKAGPKGIRPIESGMPIRGDLAPNLDLRQRNPLKIWRIETLEDAEACASDIANQFRSYGLSWINRTFDIASLQSLLLNDATTELQAMPNGAHLWIDAGALDSPNRNRKIAELARAQGNYALASDRFERARWARNVKTGERFLNLSADADAELQKLAQECARLT